jgi:uncharacterized small protein (DUF1192 family)
MAIASPQPEAGPGFRLSRRSSGLEKLPDGEFVQYSRRDTRQPWGAAAGERIMSNDSSLSLGELDRRIAILRDNIRQLVEQAAAFSGDRDESRNADRIAQQSEELDRLVKQRDALMKK